MRADIVFWDVDTQHDFMDADGKLSVPDAAAIVPNLDKLTRFAVDHRIPIVASADAHAPDDPEFEQFPPHCVAGTPGQRKIEATSPAGGELADPARLDEQISRLAAGQIPQLVIEKQDVDVFTVPAAAHVVRALAPQRVFVYGVAAEYCVHRAVMGLLNRRCGVTVVADAVRGVDGTDAELALQQMREAGAEIADTETVLRQALPSGS